jgi:hypothetical protein
MRLATTGRIISSCLGPGKEETEASRVRAAAPINGFVTEDIGGVGVSVVVAVVAVVAVDLGLAADALLKNESVEIDVASWDGRDARNDVGSIEGVKAEGVDDANGLATVSSKV